MKPTQTTPTPPKILGTVSIRPAVTEDFEQMAAIDKMSYPDPWSAQQFLEETKKHYAHVYVLTDDETDSFVVGYIVYWVQVEGVSLLNVTVHPDWRGLGFARRLLQTMISEAVRDEIAKVVLEVRASNVNAIALYKNMGFSQTHVRKKFYQNGDDALVMELKTSDVPSVIQ